MAGTTQVIATNPMETVKIRMQMAAVATSGTMGKYSAVTVQAMPTTIDVVKDLGIKGLYRGSFATLSRDVPFSMLFFQLFASFKSSLAEKQGKADLDFQYIFASGIAAGAISAYLVTPMDGNINGISVIFILLVVKTRYQATRSSKDLFTIYRYNIILQDTF